MKAAVEADQDSVEDADVRVGAVDEEPDDPDRGCRDRHRQEDHRLDYAFVANAHREHCKSKTDEQRQADVEDDPAQIVDQGAAGRELAQIEKVRVVRQQLLEVVEPDVVEEVVVKVALVEREPDRVVRGVDQKECEHYERRQHEHDALHSFEG